MPQKLINLQTTDYEHPFDKAALEALRKVPKFDSVVNFVLNWTTIKWHIVELCGSAFHVTNKSCPELYNLIEESARILELDVIPEIYTKWTYGLNAYTTGYKNDTILVYTLVLSTFCLIMNCSILSDMRWGISRAVMYYTIQWRM